MENKEINLNLNVQEVQGILNVLVQCPYSQVSALIEKIKNQTEAQLKQ